ncbi:TrgA family protein [Histidinibacterium aquaticum]|uniref:TrgA family protein n=1 Tax=Histidinibacterium aquaticum TaxID=2613962 RepID=A0A5J5GQH8_9RHOB|nr:TrgA family protein [Histidinibacterium aquaticum]KAA9009824.1 TrgA family protein [Histidinibacterium aquaticum]
MLTFAHVVAAVLYGALAWGVSEILIEPLFPEGFNPGYFAEVNAAVGALTGWIVMGSRAAGVGLGGSISIGFTTTIMVVFWCLFVQSFWEMIRRSLEMQYDGGMEAIVAVFEMIAENLVLMSTVEVWVALLVGGVLAGLVTGFFGRIWR